ncbi:TPA: TetR/AcrR family transcriptional regulator [Candidatus Micrarchaeota archaeon]|nr:TetR/AcrR family transcriptional regulator [Candidatus Micrarchaeota archaeon]
MTQVEQTLAADIALSKGARSILEVAERLFADEGFDSVSINDIAVQAEVSKANIFHHFKSKEGLYMAVLKSACEHSAAALDEVEGALEDGREARLDTFFSLHLQALLAHPRSSRLIQRELLEGGSERGRQLAKEVFSEHFSRLVRLVREGQSQDLLRKDFDAALLAFVLVGANVFFFETRAVLKHLPEVDFADSPYHYSAAIFELLSRGFAKES